MAAKPKSLNFQKGDTSMKLRIGSVVGFFALVLSLVHPSFAQTTATVTNPHLTLSPAAFICVTW
jgi:hypothetical protein